MKGAFLKKEIIFLITIFGFTLLNACSSSLNTASPISVPTSVVDPCMPANIPITLQPVNDLLYAFDDITFVANFTPQMQLTQPIMDLQSIRRKLDASESPICLDVLKKTAREYMNSVILYLSYFMGGEEKDTIDAAILTSQELRSVMDSEYQKLVGTGIPSSPSIQPSSFDVNQTPEIAVTGITKTLEVKNAGNQAVNIRKEADINSEIIGSLPAGQTVTGYGKNATGGWILVKTGSTYGWISSEMVELNLLLESIPIFYNTPLQ